MTGSGGTATIVVAGNVALLWVAGFLGVPIESIQELLWGSLVSVCGAVGWQFIEAQDAREKGKAAGVKPSDLPRVDLTTLGYAILGSFLSSGLLISLIHLGGGIVTSFWSLGLFLGAGAAGPKFVVEALKVPNRFLSGLTGGTKP